MLKGDILALLKGDITALGLQPALWGDAQKPASALLLFTMPALVCSWHDLTSMDGGNADFAGEKICQNNALILAFGHRQNL